MLLQVRLQQVTHIHPNTSATDLDVTVAQINTDDADSNMILNQAKINSQSISNNKISITINNESALVEYEPTTPTLLNTGSAKWIVIGVNTGLDDITKVQYDGTYLTTNEVLEADSFGLDEGSFALWIDAENPASSFTLQADGHQAQEFTIELINN